MIFFLWALAFLLSTLVVTFHVTALKMGEPLFAGTWPASHFTQRIYVTGYVLALHWIEIMMFGVLYYILVEFAGIGEIIGAESVRDYFYFSAANYTTVGYGDLYPTGHIRIFSGIEALVGLIMIGWTIAFTFNYVTRADA